MSAPAMRLKPAVDNNSKSDAITCRAHTVSSMLILAAGIYNMAM
jgi:hypothetical protein